MAIPCKHRTREAFGRPCLYLAVVLLLGCQSKLVPVTGTVRLDKKPLEKAGVMFHALEKGPVASGTTDARGHFELMTANKRGALPGKYKVTVSRIDVVGGETEEAVLVGGQRAVRVTPPMYGDPKATPLTATVQRDGGPFDFDLWQNSDAVKPELK
jgi:hypothetical protein